ncbi:uncharacterized protein LOC132185294 [Corylus avellana]|uniref:uncharacterized protein LOC132185294 n=1 Tax=Corylus avellana TaxID=13451 RepID=UPI00286AAFD7|nr:uncharacterized protein LOC132185294 [Corylus avellana]
MTYQNCFEAVDRSLGDILRFSDPQSEVKPFGGKTIVLGCDFRQILPAVSKGRREEIVEASVNRSSLWKYCTIFTLTKNMRLEQNLNDNAAKEFEEWILKISEGELDDSEGEALIKIPSDLLIPHRTHPINDIVDAIYSELQTKYTDAKYLEDRVRNHINMTYTPLNQISTEKDSWNVKVRIIRMWDAVNVANGNELFSLNDNG